MIRATRLYSGLCGMPAFGHAVGCDVCDTPEPELWRGAAGLCARVRARVLVPPNLYIHIHTTRERSGLLANSVCFVSKCVLWCFAVFCGCFAAVLWCFASVF